MDPLNILITGSGAPGIKGTIYSLHNNYDNRKICTYGTDIQDNVVGKYLCDHYFKISPAHDERSYLEQLTNICKNNNIDIILPQNTCELPLLSMNKKIFQEIGTSIIISNHDAIVTANDKYSLLKLADSVGIPVPKYYLVSSRSDLIKYSERLGWPNKKIVVKPPCSNGSRGFRIINEQVDEKKLLLYEKPNNVNIKMDYLLRILGDKFPPLLIMEYLSHDEYSIDVLKTDEYTIIPRKRDMIRSGITFQGTVEKNVELIEHVYKLSEVLGLTYVFGFQFIMDKDYCPKLIESNPRIQGTMIMSTLAGANIIYTAIKYALDEEVLPFNIKWGSKFLRYWGGINIFEKEIKELL